MSGLRERRIASWKRDLSRLLKRGLGGRGLGEPCSFSTCIVSIHSKWCRLFLFLSRVPLRLLAAHSLSRSRVTCGDASSFPAYPRVRVLFHTITSAVPVSAACSAVLFFYYFIFSPVWFFVSSFFACVLRYSSLFPPHPPPPPPSPRVIFIIHHLRVTLTSVGDAVKRHPPIRRPSHQQ